MILYAPLEVSANAGLDICSILSTCCDLKKRPCRVKSLILRRTQRADVDEDASRPVRLKPE